MKDAYQGTMCVLGLLSNFMGSKGYDNLLMKEEEWWSWADQNDHETSRCVSSDFGPASPDQITAANIPCER